MWTALPIGTTERALKALSQNLPGAAESRPQPSRLITPPFFLSSVALRLDNSAAFANRNYIPISPHLEQFEDIRKAHDEEGIGW